MPKPIHYSIPVPSELDVLIKRRMQTSGFNSRAEYVRAAIRADLEHAAKRELEQKLLVALNRGDYQDADTFLNDVRAFISDRTS